MYHLTSSIPGITADIHPVGASLARVTAPDRHGVPGSILLPLPPSQYGADESCAGAIMAPIAGRVRQGRVDILGKTHWMEQEGQPTPCLHSGPEGLHQVPWDVVDTSPSSVTLQATLEDGACGLPGRRTFTTCYTLQGDTLTIRITATTTQPTFVNPTNHAYWNLSGDFAHPTTQLVQVNATHVWFNDSQHLPVELHPVAGTPLDFTAPTPVDAHSPHPQVVMARGCNHAYRLCTPHAATLQDPASGRQLDLYTNAPYLVFYTGGFLGENTPLDGSGHAVAGCAYALEPQDMPDAPHHLGQALPLLLPHTPWVREITYRFSTF